MEESRIEVSPTDTGYVSAKSSVNAASLTTNGDNGQQEYTPSEEEAVRTIATANGSADGSVMNGTAVSGQAFQRPQSGASTHSKGDPWYSKPNGHIPADVLRRREKKWLKMVGKWDKLRKNKPEKIKERCRKGIPQSMRSRAWSLLANIKELKRKWPGHFQELDQQTGHSKIMDEIQRDLHRTFPEYEMFQSPLGYGQEDLRRILKCYALHNPETGYCQAMAPVAATLLMVMPAEDAFWMLVSICDNYLAGYYGKGLHALKVDADLFHETLKDVSPAIYRHMEDQKVHPLMYMTEWFMCIYSRTVQWSCMLLILDMFFCEGVKVLFRVGIAILQLLMGKASQRAKLPDLMDTTQLLRRLPEEITDERILIPQMLEVKIRRKELEKRKSAELERRLSTAV